MTLAATLAEPIGRRQLVSPLSGPRYAELQATSHFSFLRGASSCEELFSRAALAGIGALAIVDRNSLAGIVRAHEAARTTSVRLVVGRRLDLADGMSVLVYAPAQIARDAQAHGIEVRPVCVNASRWNCTPEPTGDEGRFSVRLGLRMVNGLANAHAAAIVAARADQPFASVDDLWRRAGVPVAALTRIDGADGFRSAPGLSRREALWAIRALRDDPSPLFAAASALAEAEAEAAEAAAIASEARDAAVALRPLTAGGEVVEDYRHVGLSLRNHPVSFLRGDLRRRRLVTCSEAMAARDGCWLEAVGIVLVRQRPGSARGVMFITLEDESGIANLVIWPRVFEKNRRAILSAGMIAVRGRIQREGEVVHLVVRRLTDLSAELASVGERESAFPLSLGRGDKFHHGSPTPDPRDLPPKGLRTPDICIPDLHIDAIKVKTRDFR
jgi:error-prone DNA polymerase